MKFGFGLLWYLRCICVCLVSLLKCWFMVVLMLWSFCWVRMLSWLVMVEVRFWVLVNFCWVVCVLFNCFMWFVCVLRMWCRLSLWLLMGSGVCCVLLMGCLNWCNCLRLMVSVLCVFMFSVIWISCVILWWCWSWFDEVCYNW